MTMDDVARPHLRRRLPAVIAGVLVLVSAWWAVGLLVQRRQAVMLPSPDLSALPAEARAQVERAHEAARRAPASAEAVGVLAMAYHASLMTVEAQAAYAAADALAPDEWEWTYYRGLLHEERGEQVEALAAFRRVAIANPAFAAAWFRLGELQFKQGRLEDAAQAYARAAAAPADTPFLPPGVNARETARLSAYAQLGLARVALDRKDIAQARGHLEGLLETEPDFGPAWSLRAQLAASADEAAPIIPAGAGGYVPPPDALLDRVVATSWMRDLLLKHASAAGRSGDEAWREFLVRRALEANPRDPNVLMETAMMLQASDRAGEALDYLNRRLEVVPGDTYTLVELGRCLSRLGRLEEAEATLRSAVRVRDAAAEYNLGAVLDLMGRGDEARERYERALVIDAFYAPAMNNLGVWYDRRGQSRAAIAMLERAVKAAPDSADAYSNLGSALIGIRRWPDALRSLRTATALAPRSPEAHNNLGIALAQSGRMPEAVRAWERAVSLNPNHANARRNLEQARASRR